MRMLALLVTLMGLTGCGGCDEAAKKDPEACKTEGKQSGEKCKKCCELAGKTHQYTPSTKDCFCL
jgi:predicted amidophosphoribosyltransferase